MSILKNTTQKPARIRTRSGTGTLGLSTLIAIGLGLLILIPGHRTNAPTEDGIAIQAALTSQTPAPVGCFRDPASHTLTCSQAAPASIATAGPPGYFRDPVTRKLLRLPITRHQARHLPAGHSRVRILQ
jgi:hypothetical protein